MESATALETLLRSLTETSTAARLRAAPRLDAARARLANGHPVDRALAECRAWIEAGTADVAKRTATPLDISYPEALPVSQRRDEILAELKRSPLLVLTGETGSGKTTQLPKMLLEAGHGRRGMIAVTQPRRVAAIAIAARLSEELQAPEGTVVHSVRFDDRATPGTLIRVMTDGLLLAEASADPWFSRYDAVMVDEAHERGLNVDLLLGLLLRARQRRPELAIVVSSASIAAERFAEFLGRSVDAHINVEPRIVDVGIDAPSAAVPVIKVGGRMFEVEIRHEPPGDEEVGYLDAAVRAVREVHAGPSGDVLVFLPTERDIIEAARRLDEPAMTVLPLFGRLTPHEQQRIFLPTRGRKVVLSTNIAETSLTIPGIVYVIDAGLARLKRYQPSTRTERLPIEAISQASALQRAGRAGRVAAGVCIRLYDADDLARREAFTPPEILRSNLAGVLLTCLKMGIEDPATFPWLDPPPANAWATAAAVLDELGALQAGSRTRLSGLGQSLAALPCDPQVGRILLAGLTEGCPHEVCTIAAFLSIQDPRVRPPQSEAKADAAHRSFAHEAGDLATVLNLWARWEDAGSGSKKARLCEELFLGHRRMREWADVRHQLWSSVREHGGSVAHAVAANADWPLERIHRCVLSGMLHNVLMWEEKERSYRAAGDRLVAVHPGSALRSGKGDDGKKAPPPLPWLVACEVVETSRLFARLCAPIDPAWVVELAGDRIRRRHRDPHFHRQRGMVVCTETLTWKGLPVRDGKLVPYDRIDPVEATRIFVREALAGEDDLGIAPADHNRRLFTLAEGLRHRLRDPTLHPDREHLVAAIAARIGTVVVTSITQLRGWLDVNGAGALRLQLADLIDPELARRADGGFPDAVELGGERIALAYRYAPGDADDGVSLTLGRSQAERLELSRLDWLVPGWLEETVHALLDGLPKDDRRKLIPLAATARALATIIMPHAGKAPLAQVLADTLSTQHGIRSRPDPRDLPEWLRPRLLVIDEEGATVVAGRDLDVIAAQLGTAVDRLRPLKREWETAPATTWPGDCPGPIERFGLRGWIGLARDRGPDGLVAVRRAVYASEGAWRAWHRDGWNAGIEAALQADFNALAPLGTALEQKAQRLAAISASGIRRLLGMQAALAAAGKPAGEEATFTLACAAARAALARERHAIETLIPRWLDRLDQVKLRLKQGARSLAAVRLVQIASTAVDRLAPLQACQSLPWDGLRRVDAYLDGWQKRLDHVLKAPGDAVRLMDRGEHLSSIVDEAADLRFARQLAALDLLPQARELRMRLEECLLALSSLSPGAGLGAAEGLLRARAQEVSAALSASTDRIARLRAELIEAQPILTRHAPGAARTRLAARVNDFLRSFPDWSLGCDLAAQESEGRSLLLLVRRP